MPRRYLPLTEIREKMCGWTLLVQVVERSNVQVTRGALPTKFRRLILTDSEGTKISAVIYGNDIRFFAALLLPFKRYYISNASVKPQDVKFRVSHYEYAWVLNNSTLVEEYIEPVPPQLPCSFEFTRFSDLFKFAETDKLQNVLAIVVCAFPAKEQNSDSTTRDFVVVDQEKKPMLLTMWNEFEQTKGAILANTIANDHVIIANKVKVTTFNTLSLTTRMSTCLLIDPPAAPANELKEWYNVNKQDVLSLVEQTAYKDSVKLLPPPKQADILQIQIAATTLKNDKTAWIKGKATLIPGQVKFWYTACINCQKFLDAETEWAIKCPSCKEDTKVEARCRMGIAVDDGTGSLNTAIFGLDAEKLIPFTAAELKQADEEGNEFTTDSAASVAKYTLVCFVRHYDLDNQGQRDSRYTVIKAYTTEELMDALTTTETTVASSTEDRHATSSTTAMKRSLTHDDNADAPNLSLTKPLRASTSKKNRN